MAIVQYRETLMENLSDIAILEGQLIYCTDTRTSLYDAKDGSRIEIDRLIVLDTESEKLNLHSPAEDRIYVVRETECVYRYTGLQWYHITDSAAITDLLNDVDLIVPVKLEQSGQVISPQVLAESVRNSDGLTLEEMLQEAINKTHIGLKVSSVIAKTDMQRSFEVPFPFENYLRLGNGFLCYLGTMWVDPVRYTVNGNKLIFNNNDDGVGLGRKLSFIFIYNTVNPADMSTQVIEGTSIVDGSIPLSKLEGTASMIAYSDFTKEYIVINDETVEINDNYFDANKYYYGGSRASINIHLVVKDPELLYSMPIANIAVERLPKAPIENILLSTDAGPVDASIDITGKIWIGMNLRPYHPTKIDGTIQIML